MKIRARYLSAIFQKDGFLIARLKMSDYRAHPSFLENCNVKFCRHCSFSGDMEFSETSTRYDFHCPDCGWRVATGNKSLNTSGKGPIASDLSEFAHYEFEGEWKTYKGKYQFVWTSCVQCVERTRDGIVKYLSRFDGVGPVTADQIYNMYGEDTLQKICEHPGDVADHTRLRLHQVMSIASVIQMGLEKANLEAELFSLLGSKGFPRGIIGSLLHDYGTNAAKEVRQNPYCLLRYRGAGFQRTDALYQELGLFIAAPIRQAYLGLEAIKEFGDGSIWFDSQYFKDQISRNVPPHLIDYDAAIQYGFENDILTTRTVGDVTYIANPEESRAEYSLSESSRRMMDDSASWPEMPDHLGLTEHQLEKYSEATGRRLAILAGSPGVGKTFVAAAIVKQLQRSGQTVAVCAPTGKAAVRIQESLKSNGVNTHALTIHRLLQAEIVDHGFIFHHNDRHPLPFDAVVVDEASMIDSYLLSLLMRSIDPGAKVLLVGDTNQLPPVGPGAPLRDLINAGANCGALTEIRRNSGRIVRACAEIRDGSLFNPSRKMNLEEGENLDFIQSSSTPYHLKKIIKIGEWARRNFGYHPVWDVQVLCATNNHRRVMNELLQDRLNYGTPRTPNSPFKRHDKVICLRNGFYDCLDSGRAVYCCNGELGKVSQCEPGYISVKLQNPDRHVMVRRAKPDPKNPSCLWDLGYAITVHKSQGSSWPVVVTIIENQYGARMICSREWVYTAISRAEKLSVLCGRLNDARDMCKTVILPNRYTHLSQLITGEISDGSP